MNSIIIRSFLVLVLFTACSLAAHAGEPATTPAANPFESEITAFEKWDRQNAFPKDPVLFVGSSTIRLWQTADAFPDLPVINRGFGGSTISDVNHFFDRIVHKYQPRVIVFYSGDNDIAGGKSPQRVSDDFQQFAEFVRDGLPKTRILFLSIKPSIARQKLWPKMEQANALIKQLADEDDRLEYVDTAAPMLGSDGTPRSELFLEDGLHLNPKGYQAWNNLLAGPLNESLSTH